MTEADAIDCNSTKKHSRIRRFLARSLTIAMLSAIAIEVLPYNFRGKQIASNNYVKELIAPATRYVGLWQGEWPLFAPDPVINNAWISAEIRGPDGNLELWNSPYWATASSAAKFRNFRHMNFYTRMPFQGKDAINDFADYIARQEIGRDVKLHEGEGDHWELRLFRNQLKIVLPDDGTLPSREEALWVSQSVNLTTREYQP